MVAVVDEASCVIEEMFFNFFFNFCLAIFTVYVCPASIDGWQALEV
jgi:hypothetical protein